MKSPFRVLVFALVPVVTTAAGCAPGKNDKPADSPTGTPRTGSVAGVSKDTGAGGMAGMPGMAGTSSANGMMDSIETHMRATTTTPQGQLTAILPAHRQTIANMLSQMNQEMRSMSMPATPAWTATMDSVRQDLIRQPELSARELAASLPAHHARITHLLQMHRDMMSQVKSQK